MTILENGFSWKYVFHKKIQNYLFIILIITKSHAILVILCKNKEKKKIIIASYGLKDPVANLVTKNWSNNTHNTN